MYCLLIKIEIANIARKPKGIMFLYVVSISLIILS